MTLGAKYVDTMKSFQGHAAICTKVPPFEAASEDVPPDEEKSARSQVGGRFRNLRRMPFRDVNDGKSLEDLLSRSVTQEGNTSGSGHWIKNSGSSDSH
eukprot:COSAG02_NODE_286_length_25649_cov_13.411272_1_plen_98_part_00